MKKWRAWCWVWTERQVTTRKVGYIGSRFDNMPLLYASRKYVCEIPQNYVRCYRVFKTLWFINLKWRKNNRQFQDFLSHVESEHGSVWTVRNVPGRVVWCRNACVTWSQKLNCFWKQRRNSLFNFLIMTECAALRFALTSFSIRHMVHMVSIH
jgi:hypothetical protein